MMALTILKRHGTQKLWLRNVEETNGAPDGWTRDVRQGRVDYDCTNRVLDFGGVMWRRVVYSDQYGPFIVNRGTKVRLPDKVRDALGAYEIYPAKGVDRAAKRRARADCTPMPDAIGQEHVESVLQWPLGSVKTNTIDGEGWTDCLLVFVDDIRTGGAHNSRRVRYDGRFYITYNNVKRYVTGALVFDVLDVASHVYGIDAESDVLHNRALKGY